MLGDASKLRRHSSSGDKVREAHPEVLVLSAEYSWINARCYEDTDISPDGFVIIQNPGKIMPLDEATAQRIKRLTENVRTEFDEDLGDEAILS